MKGQKPKITSWRAFVDGKQIGSGYASRMQALEASQAFVSEYADAPHTVPAIELRPSFVPTDEFA